MNKNDIRHVITLFCLIFYFIHFSKAQSIPQGFNYQTSIRNSSGTIVANQLVSIRFSIYSNSGSGILQWQEDQAIQTDAYGMAKAIIGKGTSTGNGSVSLFNQINWATNAYFLKVSIDINGGSSFIDFGNTQLFSVPYALYSQTVNGNNFSLSQFDDVNFSGISTGYLLKWNGSYWIPAIDKDSDTVSYAYNAKSAIRSDSSRFIFSSNLGDSVLFSYYTDSAQYGLYSGNSINSSLAVRSDTALYSLSSAPSGWLLQGNSINTPLKYIGTNDSIDIIAKTNNTEQLRFKANGKVFVGIPSSYPDLGVSKTDGLLSSGSIGSVFTPVSGGGTRLIWYPSKASFRSGSITLNQWDTINSGYYSTAFGYNTRARTSSFASGGESEAVDYSIAIGRRSKANATGAYPGGSSIALGDSCISNSARSVSIGRNNVSSGQAGVTLGFNNYLTGAQSVCIGTHCAATGHWSSAIGYYASTNSKNGSFVFSDASSTTSTLATVAHQFVVRASGGVIFYSDSSQTMGVSLAAGSGSWSVISDKNKKENFKNENYSDILKKIEQLKIKSWNYKSQSEKIRHIGPMAQDFYKKFGFDKDNTTITGIDMDGIILAGISELNFRFNNLSSLENINALKTRITELGRINELNEKLDRIEATLDKKK